MMAIFLLLCKFSLCSFSSQFCFQRMISISNRLSFPLRSTPQELKERIFVFQIVSSDEHADKLSFLKQLCRNIANNMFKSGTETYLRQMRAEELGLESSDISASNFGSRAYRSLHRKVKKQVVGQY